MFLDLRTAVQIDQKLHGRRFIRVEFAAAGLFTAVVAALTIRRWILHPPSSMNGLLLNVAAVIFFAGLAVNYGALFLLTNSLPDEVILPHRSDLKTITLQLSGLVLVPGAVALVAWRQRRNQEKF